MESKSYVVAIDLGTSNVVIGVGLPTDEGLEIKALVSKPCQGVNAGQVENIELVAHAIDEAKEEIRRQLGIRITEAYAGISGPYVRCASHRDYVFTADKLNGVSQSDVERLFDRMRNVQAPGDEVIMERIPQNYLKDDNTEVANPVGSFSGKLTSTFNFILCAQVPIQRLELALKRCGIVAKEIFVNPRVTPEAVLSPEDREEGVAVVNIGGGLTDVSVYYGGILRYVGVIPLGGNAINRDIRSQSIPEKHVESLKCRFGSAVAELAPDNMVRIKGRTPREAKDLPLRNLATIIEARLKDVVDFVLQEIRTSGYAQKLGYGLVLTGGSACLNHIADLFSRATDYEVRIGLPETGLTEASYEACASPVWATVTGLLLHGAEKGVCNTPIDEQWQHEREQEERERLEEEKRLQAEREAAEARERAAQEQQAREELARMEAEERERNARRRAELEQQLREKAPVPPTPPIPPTPPVVPPVVPPIEPPKPVPPVPPVEEKVAVPEEHKEQSEDDLSADTEGKAKGILRKFMGFIFPGPEEQNDNDEI